MHLFNSVSVSASARPASPRGITLPPNHLQESSIISKPVQTTPTNKQLSAATTQHHRNTKPPAPPKISGNWGLAVIEEGTQQEEGDTTHA